MICERYHRSQPGANGKDAGSPSVLGFDAIGTRWEIETHEPLGEPLKRRVFERIEGFDATYSRFRPDSLVSRIANAGGGRFDFPDDSVALFDRLHEATGGAVDPLVGRDLELLGYDRTYSLTPASISVRAEERARRKATWSEDVVRDGTSLVTRRPLVIDVGAAGKGYLVDIVAEILRGAGFARFVVDGGGDMRHAGDGSVKVGLEHPFDPRLVIGVAELRDHALCASAVARRAWGEGLHHELDARTGVPVRDVVATWVVADDAATADGLATALFFAGVEDLAGAFRFSYARMFADGRYTAKGWYGGLPSNIDVTLTLDDGVIRDVEVTPQATDPTSRDYQERFAEAVPERVVGRPIDGVRVDRLAGSSGTPDGFNAAIEKIRERAAT